MEVEEFSRSSPSWLPLSGDHGVARRAGQGGVTGACLPHRCALHGQAHDRQPNDQPAVEATFSGASGRTLSAFPPTARSATSGWAGWATRRSSGARPLQHGPGRILAQVCRRICAEHRWARLTTASTRPEPSRRMRALPPAGATRASSFPGPVGCNPATPASSTRTGRRWRSISTPSRPPIPMDCGSTTPGFPLPTGSRRKAARIMCWWPPPTGPTT